MTDRKEAQAILDKKIYRVAVERRLTQHFLIAAPTREQAVEDAEVMADGNWTDADSSEIDVWADEVRRVKPALGDYLWTGGPDGSDVPYAEWKRMVDEAKAVVPSQETDT